MAKTTTFRCGVYLRVSTEEQKQVEEGSIKNQRQRLKQYIDDQNRYAQENKNGKTWVLVQEYEEEAKSAKDTKRLKYQEMLKDIRDGIIDTILFTEISRISRSVKNFLELGELLDEHNAHFVCLQHPELNTATPTGRILLVLLVAMMEFEREINADRSARSYEERAKRGLWTGGQILGYDLDPGKKGHLKVNTEEANIVRFIFATMLETKSPYEVATRFNERGYKTKSYKSRRGKTRVGGRISYTGIRQILSNPAYIAKRSIKTEDQDQELIDTDCWKPIITQRQFDDVQRLLATNKKRHSGGSRSKSYEFLLTQLLACPRCHSVLTNSSTQKGDQSFPHYVHRKGQRKDDCPLPQNISADKLDDAVWNRLSQEIDIETELRQALTKQQQDSPSELQRLQESIDETRRAISENKTFHATTLEAFRMAGSTPDRLTAETLATYSKNIESLEAQLNTQQEKLQAMQEATSVDTQMRAVMKNKRTAFQNLPVEQRSRIAKILLKGIILNADNIILDRRVAEPIVGVLKQHTDKLSHPYRFMDVEWLN